MMRCWSELQDGADHRAEDDGRHTEMTTRKELPLIHHHLVDSTGCLSPRRLLIALDVLPQRLTRLHGAAAQSSGWQRRQCRRPRAKEWAGTRHPSVTSSEQGAKQAPRSGVLGSKAR